MADTPALVAEIPDVCGGRATVVGRRIEVRHVLGWLASGMSTAEIAAEYGLEPGQIRACLGWAEELVSRHYGLDADAPPGRLVSERRVERRAPH